MAFPWTPYYASKKALLFWDPRDSVSVVPSGSKALAYSSGGSLSAAGIQATAASQPDYSATGLNGYPAIVSTGGTVNLFVGAGSVQPTLVQLGAGACVVNVGNVQASFPIAADAPRVVFMSWTGGVLSVWIDGSAVAVNGNVGTDYTGYLMFVASYAGGNAANARLFDNNGASVFTLFNRSQGDRPGAGSYGPILIGDYVPSQTERDMFIGWGAWGYGLQGNLPANYIYKGSAPAVATVPWDFLDTTRKPVALWDAQDNASIVPAAGKGSRWANRGTLGGAVAQATGVKQPTIDGTFFNGFQAISGGLSASSDTLLLNGGPNPLGGTVRQIEMPAGGGFNVSTDSGQMLSDQSYDGQHVAVMAWTTTGFVARKDGTQTISGTTSQQFPGTVLVLYKRPGPNGSSNANHRFYDRGTLFNRPADDRNSNLSIACMVVWDYTLSADEMWRAEARATHANALQGTLATDNPYRASRPTIGGGSPSLSVGAAALSIAARSINLLRGYTLPVVPAALAIAAQSVGLRAGRRVAIERAALEITGGTIASRFTRRLALQAASLAITCGAFEPRVSRRLVIQAASLAITGQTVNALRGFTMAVQAAAIAVTARAVDLRVSRRLVTQAAAIGVTLGTVDLRVRRMLRILPTNLAVTLASVTLRLATSVVTAPSAGRTITLVDQGSRTIVLVDQGSRRLIL